MTSPPDPDGLVDVTGLSLADVEDLPESVLGDILRRIVAEAAGDVEPVAGFQSAI